VFWYANFPSARAIPSATSRGNDGHDHSDDDRQSEDDSRRNDPRGKQKILGLSWVHLFLRGSAYSLRGIVAGFYTAGYNSAAGQARLRFSAKNYCPARNALRKSLPAKS
jgi:hypothetical protein